MGFLGPHGTFTEEALLGEADLAGAELVPLGTIGELLTRVGRGELYAACVPIENAIEGTVNATMDALVFDTEVLIQREIVLPVHLDLLCLPGSDLGAIRRVLSHPHANAQCRRYLADTLPGVSVEAANSTADAARLVAEQGDAGVAAIAPGLAAKLYGLEVLASRIEDHEDNETRFVVVMREGVPAPSGHDKTSVVCFQSSDHPGSLHGILGQFSARDINLTKLESRPTKRGLGDYCFVIDFEGHVDDEVVAACLRDLHSSLPRVKFLGSYPVAGTAEDAKARRDAGESRRAADSWVAGLRAGVHGAAAPPGRRPSPGPGPAGAERSAR